MLTEEQKKSGQNPAFACVYGTYENGYLQEGVSKRFYAACFAMQGILASPNADVQLLNDNQKAEYAFIMADKLLKQENAE